MHESWKQRLAPEFRKDYFTSLAAFVETERRNYTVYPPSGEVFNALKVTPYDDVKVVILGQDPYHGPGQANGLAFSVRDGVEIPPSLVNIFKELESDLGITPPKSGNLMRWAERGVLLLNTVLTVRAHEANSHHDRGWETFTDAIVRLLSERNLPTVFLLWGSQARQKGRFIDRGVHEVFESVHPSPRSAYSGFFGSQPFSKTNRALERIGLGALDWRP